VGTLHQGRKLFSQEHHTFFEEPASSTIDVEVGRNTVAFAWAVSLLIEDVKFHWSKKLKAVCYITIHGARGLLWAYKPLYPYGWTWARRLGPSRRQFEA